ncbi:MAG: hypothetical protein QOD47_2152 [Gemmatimonadaceae bacterium]|jgi:hypothetical protein|nr:hypothetical protein [Gemmatimonadaceae bacterium]
MDSQSFASWCGSQLGCDKSSTDCKAGAKQLFDRAYTFGDEKRVLFAGLSSLQITRKCK